MFSTTRKEDQPHTISSSTMAVNKISLSFFILSLFLLSSSFFTIVSCTETTKASIPNDEDEDLSFLEDPKPAEAHPEYADPSFHPEGEEDEHINYEDYKAWDNSDARKSPPLPFDETDVVVLNHTTFEDFVNKTKHVMVQFYAPWCGYCQSLAPEYAAAATELKAGGSDVVLAKVNAMAETELADQYNVDGFPALYLLSGGEQKAYEGDRTKDAIVSWLKKKTGPAVHNVTTTEEAEKILASKPKIVVAFVESLTGSDSKELEAAAKTEDDAEFYQTTNPDVAKIFEIDVKAKRPALVLVKKEVEKITHFDGSFTKSAILEFVSINKHPLVIYFSKESVQEVFEDPLKKQVLLFAPGNESEKVVPIFQDAAKLYKGKLVFVFVDINDKEFGKAMLEHFGIVGEPTRVVAFAGNVDGRKFVMDGAITLESIKSFVESFIADKLKPFYKSDPLPETNDDDVKVVVGKNFEEIVLDKTKDVLLEIYAPWCPHCQELEPSYNRLAAHVKDVHTIVVAKMDGTKNEHPTVKIEGFPTVLFFPAGEKTSDPIMVETELSAVELYKFLKKHATTPFKIQKPVGAAKLDSDESTKSVKSDSVVEATTSDPDVKDEL